MKGLTGTIKFDQHGLRSDFTLEIVELKKDGLIKVGVWMENMGVNFTRNFTENYNEIVDSLQNKTLVVTTIFVRYKIDHYDYFYLELIISKLNSDKKTYEPTYFYIIESSIFNAQNWFSICQRK